MEQIKLETLDDILKAQEIHRNLLDRQHEVKDYRKLLNREDTDILNNIEKLVGWYSKAISLVEAQILDAVKKAFTQTHDN